MKKYNITNIANIILMDSSSFVQDVTVVPYSIVGTCLKSSNDKKDTVVSHSDAPNLNECIVIDPCNYKNIQGYGVFHGHNPVFNKPTNASKAIYDHFEITKTGFPSDVKKIITRNSKARYHMYPKGPVIHCAGYDFRQSIVTKLISGWTREEVLEKLTKTYTNIFEVCIGLPAELTQKIIMLPIMSGQTFAGSFKKDIPELTFQAINIASNKIGKERLLKFGRSYRLCTFTENEFSTFNDAKTNFLSNKQTSGGDVKINLST